MDIKSKYRSYYRNKVINLFEEYLQCNQTYKHRQLTFVRHDYKLNYINVIHFHLVLYLTSDHARGYKWQ